MTFLDIWDIHRSIPPLVFHNFFTPPGKISLQTKWKVETFQAHQELRREQERAETELQMQIVRT